MSFRRGKVLAERASERRRLEHEAGRLLDAIPDLDTMRIEVSERRGAQGICEASYIKRIVTDHAPAVFWFPCGEKCEDGGHDLTRAILAMLRSHTTTFEGSDPCSGHAGASPCSRVLTYRAHATYH